MRENPTPKARALGRKLTAARERAGLTQKQLATAISASEPYLSRLLSGNRPASSAATYGLVAGILIGNLAPGFAEREELRRSLDYLACGTSDAKWIAYRPEERQLQHEAYLHELEHAQSVATVWPIARPQDFALPAGGPVVILAGEPVLADPDEADQLGFLASLGATVQVISAEVIYRHNLDTSFTVLNPREALQFAYIESRFTGTFLHHPHDIDPIVSLIYALKAGAQPLTPRVLNAADSAALANAVTGLVDAWQAKSPTTPSETGEEASRRKSLPSAMATDTRPDGPLLLPLAQTSVLRTPQFSDTSPDAPANCRVGGRPDRP